jgi:hypothetical protein
MSYLFAHLECFPKLFFFFIVGLPLSWKQVIHVCGVDSVKWNEKKIVIFLLKQILSQIERKGEFANFNNNQTQNVAQNILFLCVSIFLRHLLESVK